MTNAMTEVFFRYDDKSANLNIVHHASYNYTLKNMKNACIQHTHNFTEIYILLKGKAQYYIEGMIFDINPYDMIIIPAGMIHQSILVEPSVYERCVFDVYDDFFTDNHCEDYMSVIKDLTDSKYKIPGYYVKQTAIPDIIASFKTYNSPSAVSSKPVINAKTIEMMYILNNNTHFENFSKKNAFIQQIIDYIDLNYKENISLLDLETEFNYSKNHICRVFKQATGLSIKNYINIKRFDNIKKLCHNGETITDACFKSGFNNYSTFYTAYVKAFNQPPKIEKTSSSDKT